MSLIDDLDLTALLENALDDNFEQDWQTLADYSAKFHERYELKELVGEGGMGQVHRAFDKFCQRDVALKFLSKSCQEHKAFKQRFLNEIRITALLGHPNIIPLHDVGFDDKGQIFYSLKLVKGQSLRERVDQGIDLNDALEIFEKVCYAVAFAHSQAIIHRDLKPENIMVGQFGEVLLLDWGVAKLIEQDELYTDPIKQISIELTESDKIIGTKAYLSPKILSGEKSFSEQSDCFALGLILAEILTGQKAKDIQKNNYKLNSKREISCTLIAVCQKALLEENSYQSAIELRDDLQRAIKGFAPQALNASYRKLLWLMLKRNAVVSSISLASAAALIISASLFYQRIIEEKNISEANAKEAQENMQRAHKTLRALQSTAPVFIARAKEKMAKHQYEEAIQDLQHSLSLREESEAHVLLGRCHEAQLKFDKALESYTFAWSNPIKKAEIKESMTMCAELVNAQKQGELAPDKIYDFYHYLSSNGRLAEASYILEKLFENKAQKLQLYRKLFQESRINGQMHISKSGMLILKIDKSAKDISNLQYFNKAPFKLIDISGCQISNFSVLKGMTIRELKLKETFVSSLDFLEKSSIIKLDISASKVRNLTPLFQLKSLTELNISGCPINSELPKQTGLKIINEPIQGNKSKRLVEI